VELPTTFDRLLAKLLAMESGLSPSRFDWYVENLNVPVISYVKVSAPGRCLRDPSTGQVMQVPMSVSEYFQALGVAHLFDRADPSCIRAMQYSSTNALGFVGYQFGEAALQALGYYQPARSDMHTALFAPGLEIIYRGDIPHETWVNGKTRTLLDAEEPAVIATDVNEWQGVFTGKSGVNQFADLCRGDTQELIIRELLEHNFNILINLFDGAIPLPDNVTLSGVLAAAHLSGAYGVAAHLRDARVTVDEFGTPVQKYLTEFSGYYLPF
jgi:hypothetical protein